MSTPKVVQEGDRIALKTTAGFYLNCWDSSGDVRAKTWEPTDAVERHEVFTIKKLPGQRSGSVYYGERICLTTSKGICITCVNRVGNVEAKQGDNREEPERDEKFAFVPGGGSYEAQVLYGPKFAPMPPGKLCEVQVLYRQSVSIITEEPLDGPRETGRPVRWNCFRGVGSVVGKRKGTAKDDELFLIEEA